MEGFEGELFVEAFPESGMGHPTPRGLRPLDAWDLKEYLQTLPSPTKLSPVERQERPHVHDKLVVLQGLQEQLKGEAHSPVSSPRQAKEVVGSVVDWVLSDSGHPQFKTSLPPATTNLMAQRKLHNK